MMIPLVYGAVLCRRQLDSAFLIILWQHFREAVIDELYTYLFLSWRYLAARAWATAGAGAERRLWAFFGTRSELRRDKHTGTISLCESIM
jgi:hypothetical protein